MVFGFFGNLIKYGYYFNDDFKTFLNKLGILKYSLCFFEFGKISFGE
jgi:hypothetical protein